MEECLFCGEPLEADTVGFFCSQECDENDKMDRWFAREFSDEYNEDSET